MKSLRKELLAGTAGLLLAFSAAAAGGTVPAFSGMGAETNPSLTTIRNFYNTEASTRLKKMESAFAQDVPAGTPKIVLLDYDQISVWFLSQTGPDTLDKAVGDYLTAKTGKPYDPAALHLLAGAMDSLKPMSLIRNPQAAPNTAPEKAQCLVVPQYPGISFETFYAQDFQLSPGSKSTLTKNTPAIGLSTQDFGDFATRHEIWHCLDTRYATQTQFENGPARILNTHKSEVFADLGGVAESLRQGANLTLIDKIAAMRATWIWTTGPARAQASTPQDDEYYKSAIYHTHPALSLLKKKIQEMGLAQFRKLDRPALRDMLYDVTEQAALSPETLQQLAAYYHTGEASKEKTALQPVLQELKRIAAASLRGPELSASFQETALTPEQFSRRQQELNRALRAAAGTAEDTALLQAKAALTDKIRNRMDKGENKTVERDMTILFYTNPRKNP